MTYKIKHGFLGQEYCQQYKQIRRDNKTLFELCSRVNDLSHSLYDVMGGKVPTDDLQIVSLSSLFIKSMTSFQGIVILSSKGIHKEKNIILRTFLELFFWIMAIAKSNDSCKKYVLLGEYNRLKSARTIRDHRPSWHEVFGGIEKINDTVKTYEKEYERLKEVSELSQEEIQSITQLQRPHVIAKLGDISETYLAIYDLLSIDVHSNSLCLDDYFTVDDFKNIMTIDYGPRSFDINRSLTASIGIQLQICNAIVTKFELSQFEPEIEDIRDKLIENHPEFK